MCVLVHWLFLNCCIYNLFNILVTKPGRCPASVELGGVFWYHRALLIGSRARWRERTPSGHLQATDRTPAGDRTESVSKWEFFCRCGSNYRPKVGRTSEGIRPVPEQVTGHRAIAGRVVKGLWTITSRCSSDLTRTWVPSYSVTLSVHHYGFTEATSNGTRSGSSKVPVQPGPSGNTKSRREGATERPQKRKTLVGARVDPTQTPFRPLRDSHEETRGRASCRLQSLSPHGATDVLWVA